MMNNFNDRVVGFLNKWNARLAPKPRRKPDGPPYADIYARALAAMFDFTIIYYLLVDLFRIFTGKFYSHVDSALLGQAQQAHGREMYSLLWQSQLPQWWLINAGAQIAVIGLLVVGAQCIWGNTPGKWIMGLRIVRHPGLEKPARWRYIVRYLGYIPAAGFFMIGIFWISFNTKRRGWHDYLAGTVVLSERPAAWYWNKAKHYYLGWRGKSVAAEETVRQPPAEKGE